MKTITAVLISITLLSFLPASPPAITMHQPDFTEAHYWSKDSIWVVEESNTGSARTLHPGQSFEVVCDFMQCTDSITTFLRTPRGNGDTISYRKIQTGYWRAYRNGERTGQAAVETAEVMKVEDVEGYNEETGESYALRIEYMKTILLPDTFKVSGYRRY